MKTIEYTLTLTGIEPANVQAGGIQAGGVQAGGVQGDHNMTALVFYVDQELWQDISDDIPLDHNIRCHVEVADGTGGAHASDLLELATPPSGTTVPDNTARMITYTIPKEITLAGGVAQFFLVISDVDNESLSSRTLYSFPARVRFDASVAGTTSADNYYGDVNGALDALLKAFPVGTEKIKDNAVTTDKLATGAVTADKLGTAAVTSAKIVAGAVTSDKLESGAVTTDKLGTGAVTTNKIAARAVTSSRLDEGYISTDYTGDLNALHTPGMYRIIPNDTIEQHRPDEVNAMSVLVMDTGVTAGSSIYVQLAVSTSEKNLYIRASHGGTGGAGWTDWENIADIADGSITADKLADSAVTAGKIADGAVTRDKLGQDIFWNYVTADFNTLTDYGLYVVRASVNAPSSDASTYALIVISDGNTVQLAIPNSSNPQLYMRYLAAGNWSEWKALGGEVADGSITTTKLADGAVTAEKIPFKSITSDRIKDLAITPLQIAPGAVIDSKLADGAVTGEKIAPGAVTGAKIAGNTIDYTKLSNNAVTVEKLAGGAVTTEKIQDGAVTVEKLAEGVLAAAGGNLAVGRCDTAAATATKTVTIEGYTPAADTLVAIYFPNGNTAPAPKLSINGEPPRNIYRGRNYTPSMNLAASEVVLFYCNGGAYMTVEIPDATTSQAGKVQLNNTLTSTSTTQALTAAQGKALKDMIDGISDGGGGGNSGLPFYSQYNFNIDEVTEDCIRVVGGMTTGTKPPCNNYALVTTFTPLSPSGWSDGGYMLQMAQSDNGKLYTRYNYSTPPNWSAWQTGSN